MRKDTVTISFWMRREIPERRNLSVLMKLMAVFLRKGLKIKVKLIENSWKEDTRKLLRQIYRWRLRYWKSRTRIMRMTLRTIIATSRFPPSLYKSIILMTKFKWIKLTTILKLTNSVVTLIYLRKMHLFTIGKSLSVRQTTILSVKLTRAAIKILTVSHLNRVSQTNNISYK